MPNALLPDAVGPRRLPVSASWHILLEQTINSQRQRTHHQHTNHHGQYCEEADASTGRQEETQDTAYHKCSANSRLAQTAAAHSPPERGENTVADIVADAKICSHSREQQQYE